MQLCESHKLTILIHDERLVELADSWHPCDQHCWGHCGNYFAATGRAHLNTMAEVPEIIVSRRGGKKLFFKGHTYYRRDARKGNTYWGCRRSACKATAVTTFHDGAIQVLKEREHSHAPNREETDAQKFVHNLKRIASDHPELPPAQILRTEMPKVTDGVLSQLPERENLKKAMRRERRRDQPKNPLSLAELREIPDR